MEIEAKFRVDDPAVFTRLLAMKSIGPFTLRPSAEPEVQHNVYYDTDDARIRSAKCALRIRTVRTSHVAAFKTPTRMSGAVGERGEWEVEVTGDPDPTTWPPSEARTRAEALVQGAALRPIVTVDTVRRHILALRGETPIADLCLDEGTISAAGRSAPIREMEVELLDDQFQTVFESLLSHVTRTWPLAAEPVSKLARGLALRDGKR